MNLRLCLIKNLIKPLGKIIKIKRQNKKMILAEQKNNNVEIQINEEKRIIKNCKVLKLMNSLYDKTGDKYTYEEMFNYGFDLK